MKGKWILIFIFLKVFSANAQIINNLQLSSPSIVSPDAASLGKYGAIPVNLSTGIPGISIPFYEIKEGNISVPISLSYHAGGNKVDEVASWVGLGWSLNAGGVVSRMQRGLPDNNDPSYSGIGFKNYGYLASQFYSMTSAQKAQYLYDIEHKYGDGEPDIFYYNFGNYSGKFFFNNSGLIVSVPQTNLKITYKESPRGWEIVTPDGTTYLFNEAETSNSEVVGSTEPNQLEPETSWYLKSIKDVNNNIVQFQYIENTIGFETIGDENVALPIVNGQINYVPNSFNQPRLYNIINGKMLSKILFSNGEINFIASSQPRLDDGNFSLSKITIQNNVELIKEVHFNTSYFSSGNARPEKRLKLESIVEKIPSTSTEGAKHIFHYNETSFPSRISSAVDHWGFYNYNGGPSRIGFDYSGQHFGSNKDPFFNYAKATILEKITYPTGGSTVFEYEGNEATTEVAQHYGNPVSLTALEGNNYGATETMIYFEEGFTITTGDLGPDGLAHLKVYNGESIGPNPFEYNYYVSYNIYDQNNVIKYSDYNGTINSSGGESLNLPVGTYAIKVHIDNDPAGEPEISFSIGLLLEHFIPNTTINRNVGGLRIKKITNQALSGGILEVKNYKYNKFGQTLSSGTASPNPGYFDHRPFRGYTAVYDPDPPYELLTCMDHQTNGILVSSGSHYPLSTTNGSPVIYENVTQEIGDNSVNGKIETTFTSYNGHSDINYSTHFPFPPPATFEYERGHLLKETKFKKTGAGFSKVEETENTYFTYNYLPEETFGFKVGRKVYASQFCAYLDSWIGTNLTTPTGIALYLADLDWVEYSTVKSFLYLESTKLRVYDANNPSVFVETSTSYSYGSSHFLPTLITSINSKGEQRQVENKYPHEMQSGTSPNVYNEMVNRHIWSPVIEQSVYKNSTNFLQSSKSNYNYWYNNAWGTSNSNSLILPQTIESKKLTFNSEIVGRYHSYDNKGNVTSASRENDVLTTYLWGYNSQYPVAKISNSTHAIASGYISQSFLDNPPNDAQLRIHLANLRNIPGAIVIAYTYKPLVGITSETDANGRIIYYEYDGLNRLSIIRDNNNNILKKICYKYTGQPETCPIDNTCFPNWQNTTSALRCQVVNNVNTGYQEQEQSDLNACNPANTIRWVIVGYNPTACPLPPTCNISNCTNDNQKCVNGVCETGELKIISTRRVKMFSEPDENGMISFWWLYYCTSAYCFSDGTYVGAFEYSTTGFCTVQICN